jgi:hypothetical protein
VTNFNIDINREYYTNQGSYMNGRGKEETSKRLLVLIHSTQRKNNSPISLGWIRDDYVVASDETKEVSESDAIKETNLHTVVGDCDSISKGSNSPNEIVKDNAIRSSNRQRKPPVTRKDDFLWSQ